MGGKKKLQVIKIEVLSRPYPRINRSSLLGRSRGGIVERGSRSPARGRGYTSVCKRGNSLLDTIVQRRLQAKKVEISHKDRVYEMLGSYNCVAPEASSRESRDRLPTLLGLSVHPSVRPANVNEFPIPL